MTERTTLSDLRYARKALETIIGEVRKEDHDIGLTLAARVIRIAETALEETVEPTVPFRRAGGAQVCPSCFSRYQEHPLDRRPEARGDNDQPFLRVLCNGERVKL